MANRINHQPIFLLTSKAWRENSLWIEAFSRDYGRVALLARSARTRGSELRGVLVPFVPILVSWFGKEELKTVHQAEWLGGWGQPSGRALFHAMYINELVWKLTAREDAHVEIYAALFDVMQKICVHQQSIDALRQFEWRLLTALGIAPDFVRDEAGQLIDDEADYWVRADEAVQRVDGDFGEQPEQGVVVRGTVLRQIRAGQFDDGQVAHEATQVMRMLMDFRLPEIRTRQVLQQLNRLKKHHLLHD